MRKLLFILLMVFTIVSFSTKLVSIYPEVSENQVRVVAVFDGRIKDVETDWNLSKTVFSVFVPNVDITSSMFFIPVSVGPVEAVRVINVGKGIMITTHLLIPGKASLNTSGSKLIIEFPRSKERMDVAFTKDMTFESMVKYLAERLNLNVVVSGDLGRLNLKLNDVTPEDALRDLFFAIGDVAYSYFPDGTMYVGKFEEVSKRFGRFWGIYKLEEAEGEEKEGKVSFEALVSKVKEILPPEVIMEYIPTKSALFVFGTGEEHQLIASLISVTSPVERIEYDYYPVESNEASFLLNSLKDVYVNFNFKLLEPINKVILEGSKETLDRVVKYLELLKYKKTGILSKYLVQAEYDYSPATTNEVSSLLKSLSEIYCFEHQILEPIERVILVGDKETISRVKKYLDILKHRKTEEIRKKTEKEVKEKEEKVKEEVKEIKKEKYYFTVSDPQLAAELLKALYGIDAVPVPQRNIIVVEIEPQLKKSIEEILNDLGLTPGDVLEMNVLKDEVKLVKDFLSSFFGISPDRVQTIDVNEKYSRIVLRLQKELIAPIKEALKSFLKVRRTERKKEIIFLEKELDPKIVSAMNVMFNVNVRALGKVLIIEGLKEDVKEAKDFVEEITKEIVYYGYVEATVDDAVFSELKKLIEMETKVTLTDNLKNLGMILMKSEEENELNRAKTIITNVLKKFEKMKKKSEKEILIKFVPKKEGLAGEDVKKILSLMHNISVELTGVGYVLMGEKSSLEEAMKTLEYLSGLIKEEKVDLIKIMPELKVENISSILQNIFKLKTFVSDGILVLYGKEEDIERAKSFYKELQKLIPKPVIKKEIVKILNIPTDFPVGDFKNMINLAVPDVKVVGIPGFSMIVVKGSEEEIDKTERFFRITLSKFKELIEEKKKLDEEKRKEEIKKYVKLTFSVPKKFPFDDFNTFMGVMIPESKNTYLESIDLVVVEIPEGFEKVTKEYFDFFLKKFLQKVEEEKPKEEPVVTKRKILEFPPIVPANEFVNLSKLFAPSAEIAVFSKLGYLVIIGREEDIETVEELLKLCVDKFKRIEEEKRKIAEKEKKPEKPEYVKVTDGKFSVTADNVNLGELIKEIADKLNISIVFVNMPTERVSMRISNITWEDFKRIISKNYGYIFEEDPSGVVIIEKVKKEQETVTKRYVYRIPHNFEQIKSLVEFYGGTVYVDDLNNYMVITGIPESLKKELDKVIEEFSKPTKQVEIEVKVIDKKIADKILKDLSTTIQVPGYGSISFSSGTGGELNTNVGIIDAMDYEKFLEALTDILLDVTLTSKKSVDLSEILAAPKIVTVSGQEARIFIGNRVPYPVPTEEGYEIRYLDTGVDLEIKPFVRSDDTIELSIYTKVSDLADYSTPLGMMPGEVAREARTNVIIKNGDTVIIGGLLREKKETNEAKLPFLSSIPIIGELFKYKKEETEKRNLLIFITAKVVEF